MLACSRDTCLLACCTWHVCSLARCSSVDPTCTCVQRQYERLRDSEEGVAPALNLENTAEIIELTNLIDSKSQVCWPR